MTLSRRLTPKLPSRAPLLLPILLLLILLVPQPQQARNRAKRVVMVVGPVIATRRRAERWSMGEKSLEPPVFPWKKQTRDTGQSVSE